MQTRVITRKLCRKILLLSMTISEETKTDVYVKYFPHVNEFDIEIFPAGFKNNHKDVTQYEIDLTGDDAEINLRDIKKNLKEMWRGYKCQK